ncbi:hypothetical protein [Azospirillum sp. ST 5-10]|uniref:hypothetical protein n=1 Tax=unclassified Azospirillum TaxID=2630922 RepID=UPI003F49DC07
MPMRPEHPLALARAMLATADEAHWRAATRFAHDAVYLAVSGAVGRDPDTFAGNPRSVRDALWAADPATAPAFLGLARRHWNTLWLASLRAERALDESVTRAEAQLCVALAEQILAARSASLF